MREKKGEGGATERSASPSPFACEDDEPRKATMDKETTKRAAFERTHGMCILCGRPLDENPGTWSVEHLIPQALAKWSRDDAVRRLVTSPRNIFVTHRDCNQRKDSTIPTKAELRDFHADEDVLADIRELYREALPAVNDYRLTKKRICDAQGHRCYICGKFVDVARSTLRRIDNGLERTPANGMCVCRDCNERMQSSRDKERMMRRRERRMRRERDRQ